MDLLPTADKTEDKPNKKCNPESEAKVMILSKEVFKLKENVDDYDQDILHPLNPFDQISRNNRWKFSFRFTHKTESDHSTIQDQFFLFDLHLGDSCKVSLKESMQLPPQSSLSRAQKNSCFFMLLNPEVSNNIYYLAQFSKTARYLNCFRLSSKKSYPLFISPKAQNLESDGLNFGLEREGFVVLTSSLAKSKTLKIFKTRNKKILKSMPISADELNNIKRRKNNFHLIFCKQELGVILHSPRVTIKINLAKSIVTRLSTKEMVDLEDTFPEKFRILKSWKSELFYG